MAGSARVPAPPSGPLPPLGRTPPAGAVPAGLAGPAASGGPVFPGPAALSGWLLGVLRAPVPASPGAPSGPVPPSSRAPGSRALGTGSPPGGTYPLSTVTAGPSWRAGGLVRFPPLVSHPDVCPPIQVAVSRKTSSPRPDSYDPAAGLVTVRPRRGVVPPPRRLSPSVTDRPATRTVPAADGRQVGR